MRIRKLLSWLAWLGGTAYIILAVSLPFLNPDVFEVFYKTSLIGGLCICVGMLSFLLYLLFVWEE